MTNRPLPPSSQDNLNALPGQAESIIVQQQNSSKWLKAIYQEQQAQTKFLKNINTVATLFGLLLILSLLAGCCVAFFSLSAI